ncbi:MAG TPA: hypothetical protein VKA08_11330 [Balneolales bacterium]|nr:hypothetical protein [Balneolales bacterium]
MTTRYSLGLILISLIIIGGCNDRHTGHIFPKPVKGKEYYGSITFDYKSNPSNGKSTDPIRIRFVPDSLRYYYTSEKVIGFVLKWSGHDKVLNDMQIRMNDCPDYSTTQMGRSLDLSGTFTYHRENGNWIIEQTGRNSTIKINLSDTKPDTLHMPYPDDLVCN